jgi:hypothetical protein
MHYHLLIISLHEPFILGQLTGGEGFREIVWTSTQHLEILVRLYYLRHSFTSTNSFLLHPLNRIAFNCLSAIVAGKSLPELEDIRSALVLALKGLYDQSHNFYVAKVFFFVIQNYLGAEERVLVEKLVGTPDAREDENLDRMRDVRSQWPVGGVSMLSKPEDMEMWRLERIAEQYVHGWGGREPGS